MPIIHHHDRRRFFLQDWTLRASAQSVRRGFGGEKKERGVGRRGTLRRAHLQRADSVMTVRFRE